MEPKDNDWSNRCHSGSEDSGIWITLSLRDEQTPHSDFNDPNKVKNWHVDGRTFQEVKIDGVTKFKDIESGEVYDMFPISKETLNSMRLQTDLMKTALGEKDN